MTLMWHPDGFTQSDLHKVMEKAYQWSYARNIGVLSRVVCFTLDEMDPDYVSAHPEFQEGSDHVPNEGEISSVVRRVVLRHGPIDRALTRTTRARARARALSLSARRARSVSGELAEFHAFIQEDFGEWNVGLPEPHIELLLHS